ncbi:M48 family metallopeptidase [Stella sp.]|uniref:M48 family metallopeptidase n=1 Tax=Stella sp. TaxID=2912054 RepID=UPI0035B37272
MELPIRLKVHPRASRIVLRVDPQDAAVDLVVPRGVRLAEAVEFARSKGDWIRRRIEALPPRVPFADGSTIPVLGFERRIRHRGPRCRDARGVVWLEPGELHVVGEEAHLPRRVADWLKLHARDDFTRRARQFAAETGRPLRRVTVRDTRSRWGSCAVDGSLSFSWRLVHAPRFVIDYVVAHEVAHLSEMNHGHRFWAVVDRLVPDIDRPRAWLRDNGGSLLRYG